jgi:hypothetical protein
LFYEISVPCTNIPTNFALGLTGIANQVEITRDDCLMLRRDQSRELRIKLRKYGNSVPEVSDCIEEMIDTAPACDTVTLIAI